MDAMHNEDYVNKIIQEQVEEVEVRGIERVSSIMRAGPFFSGDEGVCA